MSDEPTAPPLPPEPKQRSITPAPEDFRDPPPGRKFLWPLFFGLLAVLLWAFLDAGGWRVFEAH